MGLLLDLVVKVGGIHSFPVLRHDRVKGVVVEGPLLEAPIFNGLGGTRILDGRALIVSGPHGLDWLLFNGAV